MSGIAPAYTTDNDVNLLIATSDGIRQKEESKKLIKDMLKLIEELRQDVLNFIKKNTVKLAERIKNQKARSWTDVWQGKHTGYGRL